MGKRTAKYRTILADPPWESGLTGLYQSRRLRLSKHVYPLMPLKDIMALPVESWAEEGCHLWLWTINSRPFFHEALHVMEAWGFTFLAPIHWVKPSGLGNYFIHRTQTLLFGYYRKCQFHKERYKPNVIMAKAGRHSEKPVESYELIESISDEPRLELFARAKRSGWDVWGNEVKNDIDIQREEHTIVALQHVRYRLRRPSLGGSGRGAEMARTVEGALPSDEDGGHN